MAGKGRPFERGNTAGKGRPTGSRNKLTIFREALDSGGVEIIELVRSQALKCDPVAMKLCMERLIPVTKTPNSRFQLPSIDTAAELAEAISAVTRAVALGRLSAREGESVAKIIESQRRTLETEEFDARLKVLEEASGKRPREES